jgi:hydrogenase maturation protease
MARVLILACGNPLRCDDGVAWRAAEELSRLHGGDDVEIVSRHQLTPELAVAVSQAETVLFLDAGRIGAPGEIMVTPLQAQPDAPVFFHDVSPQAILALSRQLYGVCPRAWMVSMGGECFDHGETLSPGIEHRLPLFVARIADLVRAASATEAQPAGARADSQR